MSTTTITLIPQLPLHTLPLGQGLGLKKFNFQTPLPFRTRFFTGTTAPMDGEAFSMTATGISVSTRAPNLGASALFGVKDVVAVVTGGGTGIGLMIAQGLEANGAIVYIVGRRLEILEQAAKTAKHGNIKPFKGDVTSRNDISNLVEKVEASHGRLDVLVNCAGVMTIMHQNFKVPEDGSIETIQEMLMAEVEGDWQKQFEVNVTGVYFVTAAFLKLLQQSNEHWSAQAASVVENASNKDPQTPAPAPALGVGSAQVITVAGIAAYMRTFGSCMGYAASKAAVMHLMKTMATVMAPTGIRFNILAPGIFPTEITAGRGHLDDHNRNHLGPIDRKKVPLGRAGDAEDIAGAVLFLCGRSGFYCNGSVVVLDGGRLSIAPSTY